MFSFFKQKPVKYLIIEPIGVKHNRMFGEGSWEKLEQDVLKRHPEWKNHFTD